MMGVAVMTEREAARTGPTLTISDRDFTLFQRLILAKSGIFLAPFKKPLLVSRLSKRLRALGIASFREYYRYVKDNGEREEREMLNCICTHETRFFRESHHYAFLNEVAVPYWRAEAEAGRRSRQVRVWSAACSSGQEPYSLAMTLLAQLPEDEGWNVDILATDLSSRVLDRAATGVYKVDGSVSIPEPWLKRFMLRGVGSQQGMMAVGGEVRRAVRFAQINLNAERYEVGPAFDLVVCSNVLIYFDAPTKRDVANRLLEHLRPDGVLMVGHSESLTTITDRARPLRPTVYTKMGSPFVRGARTRGGER